MVAETFKPDHHAKTPSKTRITDALTCSADESGGLYFGGEKKTVGRWNWRRYALRIDARRLSKYALCEQRYANVA